jgi:hypothetical protein
MVSVALRLCPPGPAGIVRIPSRCAKRKAQSTTLRAVERPAAAFDCAAGALSLCALRSELCALYMKPAVGTTYSPRCLVEAPRPIISAVTYAPRNAPGAAEAWVDWQPAIPRFPCRIDWTKVQLSVALRCATLAPTTFPSRSGTLRWRREAHPQAAQPAPRGGTTMGGSDRGNVYCSSPG